MSLDHNTQPELLLGLDAKTQPAHTALVVVDMQNDFCSPGGFIDQHTDFDAAGTNAIIENIQALRSAAHEHGALVVHVKSHFDADSLNPPMRERLVRLGVEPYCVTDTWGAQIIDQLAPADGEVEVVKSTYDGFYETELDVVLAERGIKTVIVTGLATDNCVAATAKGAFFRGFYVVLPADGCVAGSPVQHEAALTIARHAYAEVCDSRDVLASWES